MNYIQSTNNAKVKQWRKLLTKKERDRTNLFLIEGFHLIEEALKNKYQLVDLIVSETIDIPKNWDLTNIPVTVVTDTIISELSDTKTPQGVVAVCEQTAHDYKLTTESTFILIDEIQDPGNVGTIIRTADAAGIDAVIVGNGSADVYHPKVVRAAQGSHFHIKIIKGNIIDWIPKLQKHNVKIFGTSLEGGKQYTAIKSVKSFALLVGNEGSGVNKNLLTKTDENLYIPIYGQSESLNVAVATGILTYYLKTLTVESI